MHKFEWCKVVIWEKREKEKAGLDERFSRLLARGHKAGQGSMQSAGGPGRVLTRGGINVVQV